MPADTTAPLPELPALAPGLQLLETEGSATGALHSLVLDHLLQSGGRACWMDAEGNATTQPLARLAPDERVLDRIDVARAFTAFQHSSLVRTAAARDPDGIALLVAPAVDARYRADDLQHGEGTTMLVRTLAALAGVARDAGLPVLVTRTAADDFAGPVATAARDTIRFERTAMGPRFTGDDFETLVYPADRGVAQTTFAFWQRVLAARAPVHAAATPTPEVAAGGAD